MDTNDINKSDFAFYPNPAKDFINIQLGKYSEAQVILYDTTGKLIKTVVVDKIKNKINVSTLVKGVYLCKIMTNDNTIVVKKFIKD